MFLFELNFIEMDKNILTFFAFFVVCLFFTQYIIKENKKDSLNHFCV